MALPPKKKPAAPKKAKTLLKKVVPAKKTSRVKAPVVKAVVPQVSPPVDVRANLATLMAETLADEAQRGDWTYDAIRPLANPLKPWRAGEKIVGDCSKGVQWLCWWVPSCPDPMGNDFADWGNSQTIWVHLQHLDTPGELLIGDVVTFGVDGDEHATMVIKAGADPTLWSFGHQGAPDAYLLSQDGRPAQYLRLPVVYVPTPQDRLRARTGWFAWVAWRLGEGDWRNYKPADPSVRPNVPKLIPLSWWKRYAVFLKNRKKGNQPTTQPKG